MTGRQRRSGSISLDLDDLWTYMMTHGQAGWEARPSFLSQVVPIILGVLGELSIRTTFFVVGRDAARPELAPVFSSMRRAGHQFGNHSYEHQAWLPLDDRAVVEREIVNAECAIADATGAVPRGFRGPGYSWSPTLIEVLCERGYTYDASTLPTFLGPIARAYYFRSSALDAAQRQRRRALFGGFADGLRPNAPYRWALPSGGRLLEIPVTTFPVLRTPWHLSYLIYLGARSERLMDAYLQTAIVACRAAGLEPSVLLHPLDFISGDLVPQLAFFPGMQLDTERKLRITRRVLSKLLEAFELVSLAAYADALSGRGGLPVRTVRPAGGRERPAPTVSAAEPG